MAASVPTTDRVRATLLRIFEETRLCSWSTVSPANRAHINIGYYAYSDYLHLFLLSHPHSQHCRNLLANPSAAVAIFGLNQEWTSPDLGVQLFGTCNLVGETNREEAEGAYQRCFPAYRAWRASLKPADIGSAYRLYRFVPSTLKLIDEAQFGDGVFVEAEM